MPKHPDYQILSLDGVRLDDGDIFLLDLEHPQCYRISEDMSNVVKVLHWEYGNINGKRIFFDDSEQEYAEILHADGLFLGFAPGRRKNDFKQ